MKRTLLLTCLAALFALVSCQGKVNPDEGSQDGFGITVEGGMLENEIVEAYMKEVSYPDGDYSFSKMPDYRKREGFSSPRRDQPLPVSISWTLPEKKNSYRSYSVSISDGRGFSRMYDAPARENSIKVWNLIPGHSYTVTLFGNISGSGIKDKLEESSFETKGQVRMIYAPSMNNIRDLGGWKSTIYKHEDGSPKTIVYGRLYRGSEMDYEHSVTNADKDMLLNELHIGADADFRSDKECAGIEHSPLGTDFPYRRLSLSGYSDALSKDGHARQFQWMLSHLREGRNVYFHCISGADRTGTMGFLLEGILGISESDQSKDFELTSLYTERSRKEGDPKYDYGTMVHTIKSLYKCSTIAECCCKYFTTHGVTERELDEFRNIMLE